jgi:hypothetical protein
LCVGASRTSDLGEITAAIRGGSLAPGPRPVRVAAVQHKYFIACTRHASETRCVTRVGIDGGQ